MQLVDRILEAKTADPKANTSALEEEIDRLVYGLYGLTDEEIAAVAGSANGPSSAAPAKDKPKFEVVPNKGGLAPGVTPENLKDVIREMDDEYLLRKLGL